MYQVTFGDSKQGNCWSLKMFFRTALLFLRNGCIPYNRSVLHLDPSSLFPFENQISKIICGDKCPLPLGRTLTYLTDGSLYCIANERIAIVHKILALLQDDVGKSHPAISAIRNSGEKEARERKIVFHIIFWDALAISKWSLSVGNVSDISGSKK